MYLFNLETGDTMMDISTKSYLGAQVAKRRKELKLEQSEVEDYIDVSISTLSKLENGRGNISLDNLLKVIEFLGLELKLKVKDTL